MDRVQASEAWGRGFESHAARQHTQVLLKQRKCFFNIMQPTVKFLEFNSHKFKVVIISHKKEVGRSNRLDDAKITMAYSFIM